jgi:hypothetical protein
LKTQLSWIVLAGCIVGATVAVIFFITGNRRPPRALPAPPAALEQPSGDTINRATGIALQLLTQCLAERPLPQCREKPAVLFIFSVRNGAGRILGLSLEKGWLDPEIFGCWKEKVDKSLVQAPNESGKVNVQYPIACDQQGKIHIRPPVWGGSVSKKDFPKR